MAPLEERYGGEKGIPGAMIQAIIPTPRYNGFTMPLFTNYSEMLTDEWNDRHSIQQGILQNICLNCAEWGHSFFRATGDPQRGEIVFATKGSGDFVECGALAIELGFIKRTRFVTNSKQCADLRLPSGELRLRVELKTGPRTFLIKVLRDELKPIDLLEFEVTEVIP